MMHSSCAAQKCFVALMALAVLGGCGASTLNRGSPDGQTTDISPDNDLVSDGGPASDGGLTEVSDGGIAVGPLVLSRTTVAIGEEIAGQATLTNLGSDSVTLNDVVIAARPPDGTHAGGPYLDLFHAGARVLGPKGSFVLSGGRVMTGHDPTGFWIAYVTYLDSAGAWHDVPPDVSFTAVSTPVDAGDATDAGTSIDAGTATDAGVLADAGSPVDAGTVVDAGVAVDAGFDAGSFPQTPNVRVDFTSQGRATSDLSVGSCISTYSDGSTNLIKGADQALWRQYLQDLGPIAWRIPLYYHFGQVGSSAGGIHGGNEGAAYITAIKGISGTPMIAVGGTTNDNDIQAVDAANLVHYFNDNGGQNGGPVDNFIIGNEPDNGFGVNNYVYGGGGSSGFHAIATAMRSATARRLYIAGPALTSWADYKYNDYNTFFSAVNADTDVVDFHKYGDGQEYDNIYRTGQYEDAVVWLRNQVQTYFGARASQIAFQVGEYNYHPFYQGWADAFYTSRNVVHTASVIGHMLTQGGRAFQYSDSNGPLGLITDGTSNNGQPGGQHIRLPAYWGMTAWTGGIWMRRFGSVMVSASTTLADLEVFATDNAKKLVLINKSGSADRTAVVQLVGKSSGTYSAWQYGRGMDPINFGGGPQFQPPTQISSNAPFSGGWLQVPVQWMSVVVVTID